MPSEPRSYFHFLNRARPAAAQLLFAAALAALTAVLYAFTPARSAARPASAPTHAGNPVPRFGPLAYPRWAVDSEGSRMVFSRPARRIVSQYWSIDEFVYSLAPPQSVVAVSATAYHAEVSNINALARKHRPALASDPERVLRLNPDLVLVSSSGRMDYTGLLRDAGVPVFRMFTDFSSLQQVRDGIRLIGYLAGEEERARHELERFDGEIRAASARRPAEAPRPRMMGYSGGYGYGRDTLFDDAIRAIGGRNLAAEKGLKGSGPVSAELVARWDPDWIISTAPAGGEQAALRRLIENPAVALTAAARHGRIRILDNRVFFPLSPFSTRLVKALAEAVYPDPPGGKDRP